jgi:hypothetical protein
VEFTEPKFEKRLRKDAKCGLCNDMEFTGIQKDLTDCAVQCMNSAVQCSAVQCSAVHEQCCAAKHSAVQCSAVQHSACWRRNRAFFFSSQRSAVQCSAAQCMLEEKQGIFFFHHLFNLCSVSYEIHAILLKQM